MSFLPKIQWGVYGGLPECPYFRKWVIDFGPFAIRLHRWYADDDHRHPHDHPFWFYTFILRGGYTDVGYEVVPELVVEGGGDLCMVGDVEYMRPGMLRYRAAEHLHSVRDVKPNTWTLLVSGKPFRRWGFQVGHKKLMRDKYFAVYGHHPCDPASSPVRLKPDGTRIEG